ncbi:MAG: beta-galactosidase [Candidatus Devosia phytovorans]|uniref:beta-galactosidase n=1 Tax=Candidatus Devosia phytovorans TaxID=3121372 RepID=A0AAJ5VYX7_9HYPH|nr:beta-galactosidase [Devosia sp.]WEK06019.1 MAG: beta-galactosidase [Devosia sp.]
MPLDRLPKVPYGAVYFRKSNPPKEDWERDYGIAAEDGLNVFRHWFMWSAIERKPGVYDWEDFDRQLDLAARNGILTIIAELTQTTPDWAYRAYPHARQITADGAFLPPIMHPSCATGGGAHNGGGSGSLTFNCPEVRDAAGAFLTAMAKRYKGHPALLGYDVWNEVNYSADVDFSEYMKTDFRLWLKDKYGDLEALSQAWYRYSYAEWDDIEPPRVVSPYPENLDWLEFKRQNYYGQMQWKIDTIRAVDPDCLMAAHGVAGAIQHMIANGSDDWLAASKVELYGMTWVPSRRGFKPWQNFFGPDLTRSAARGKKWWHAERPAGPLWLQPQVLGHDKEDGRVMEPEDLRMLTMTSFSAGASGVMNLRYRPLLDGPLFGAFGAYGMDGSRTARSDMQSAIGKWANSAEQQPLFEAKPVQGDIGILVIPEAQAWDYLLNHKHKPDSYQHAMFGAYQGFFDNGIQADWVHIEDIAKYRLLYAPYPISMQSETATAIAKWVETGGTLISEATPGYFGDRGKVGTVQPNNGLDKVFGVREQEVEFMPDLGDRISFTFAGQIVRGGGFLQSYTLDGARELGRFADGRLAVAEHSHGAGRTLLVGTHPGIGYFQKGEAAGKAYFANVLAWAGVKQRVTISDNRLQARLHEAGGRKTLWLLNPLREAVTVDVSVDGTPANAGKAFWGAMSDTGKVEIPPRDVVVVELAS